MQSIPGALRPRLSLIAVLMQKMSSTPVSAQKAMLICLEEVEVGAWRSLPTLFRTVEKGRAVFHGMLLWVPQARAIELVNDSHQKSNKLIIQWA